MHRKKIVIELESKKPIPNETFNVILYGVNTGIDEVNEKIPRKEKRISISKMLIEGGEFNASGADTEDS